MTCPAPEVLAATVEGRLGPAEREAVLRHAAGCDDCRHILLVLGAVRPAARARLAARSWIPWAAAAVLVISVATLLVFRGGVRPRAKDLSDAPEPLVKRPPEPERPEAPTPPLPRKPEELPEREAPRPRPPEIPAPKIQEPSPDPPIPVRPAPEEPQPPEEPLPPSRPPQPATVAVLAVFDRMEGQVFAMSGQGRTPAKAGREIRNGEGLECPGTRSWALVVFPDHTRLEVEGDAVIRAMFDREAAKGRRVIVDRGAVKAEVARQAAGWPMVFETPHGEAKVLGTTLRIHVDPDPKKGTRLEVGEGKVDLKNPAGRSVLVEAGHYAVAAAGIEPASRRLPKDEVLFSFDFEDGKKPASAAKGAVERGPHRPGSRFCLAGESDGGGNSKAAFGDELTFTGEEVLSFDYWVDPQAGSVNFHFWNRTQSLAQQGEVPKLVFGKWARATFRLAEIGEPGAHPKEGDWLVSLFIQGTGAASRQFYVDNLVLTRPRTLKPRAPGTK